ncbi:MAG: sulfite exporter TauE/SafE family protein [Candidatus Nanopelagicales bacterium]|jgi:uncharacterized membrane protein YfcA
MSWGTFFLLVAAGFGGGVINAAVGSGTLLTYPALLAAGVPPVAANATNAAGLSPGGFSSAWAYRVELRDRMRVLKWALVASLVGGALGATLVVALPSRIFVALVPWLVGTATVLVAVQPVLARLVGEHHEGRHRPVWPWTGLVGVYGGYFGAAQGVMLMAVLGLVYDRDTQRSNAAKNLCGGAANIAAAVVFAIAGVVVWLAALAVALGAIAGGYVGGRLARRLPKPVLRGLVVAVGVGATLYLVARR